MLYLISKLINQIESKIIIEFNLKTKLISFFKTARPSRSRWVSQNSFVFFTSCHVGQVWHWQLKGLNLDSYLLRYIIYIVDFHSLCLVVFQRD